MAESDMAHVHILDIPNQYKDQCLNQDQMEAMKKHQILTDIQRGRPFVFHCWRTVGAIQAGHRTQFNTTISVRDGGWIGNPVLVETLISSSLMI
jgi:hypothetical protein